MKLPVAEHDRQTWRIDDIASDFTVEDVWALPVRGQADQFPELLDVMSALSSSSSPSLPSRFLFSVRWKLGEWFDWDDDQQLAIPGKGETSLRARLPEDLIGTTSEGDFGSLPFDPLYRTDREAAAEISNKTVHGVMHLGWVEQSDGTYRGQMAVLVKPRGRFGKVYMDLIKPFRYAIVYPALMRQIEQAWDTRPA